MMTDESNARSAELQVVAGVPGSAMTILEAGNVMISSHFYLSSHWLSTSKVTN